MSKEQIDNIAQQLATPTTLTGAGTGLVGFFASSYFIGLVGVLVALAGFLVNWYYKARDDRRAQREHEMRMKRLATQPGDLE